MAQINSYSGIIAGIGDKLLGINVIPPEFDAKYRQFVAGKDCILTGLDYVDGTLKKGFCLAQGYVGQLKEDITILSSYYVYGVFTVNFDKDVPDNFSVEIYDGELPNPQKDDILNAAGKYYFQIYPRIDEKEYPLKSEYSNYANVVLVAKLPSGETHLQNGVTAVTQQVNDNSDKVATTEYVHNQIIEEIGYKDITIPISSDNGKLTGSLVLKKKANYVIGEITVSGEITSLLDDFIFANIPAEFRPTKTVYFGLSAHYNPQSGSERTIYRHMELKIDGVISSVHQNAASVAHYYSPYVIGYETN